MDELSEKAKELRRAYKRAWSAKNKDKVRKYNHDYWERRAKELEQENRDEK